MWCTPQSLTPRWEAHRGAWLISISLGITKIYIFLTLDQNRHLVRYWLCGVLPTMESDSAVWCTLLSLTTLRYAHHGVWLWGGKYTTRSTSAVGCTLHSFSKNYDQLMNTTESDSTVGSTHLSLTLRYDAHCGARLIQKCLCFCVFVFFNSLYSVFFEKRTYEVNRFLTQLLTYRIIFIQYLWYDAHRGDWLLSVHPTAELYKKGLYSKWVRIMKKLEVKNLMTHSL